MDLLAVLYYWVTQVCLASVRVYTLALLSHKKDSYMAKVVSESLRSHKRGTVVQASWEMGTKATWCSNVPTRARYLKKDSFPFRDGPSHLQPRPSSGPRSKGVPEKWILFKSSLPKPLRRNQDQVTKMQKSPPNQPKATEERFYNNIPPM